jgi:REP element-mobilizing transposase RayT
LAGAIPNAGRDRIRTLADQLTKLTNRDDTWLQVQRQIFKEMEDWLDRSEQVTHLRRPEIASMLRESIQHREERGDWHMFQYVIMPSHVHLFFELTGARLKPALDDFKRWTGHRATKLMNHGGERFWQREWFDHWSRSDEEDERILRYIRENPAKAGLVARYRDWPNGSW